MTDNLPQAPYSIDLEQAILGSLMHNTEVFTVMKDALRLE